MTARDVQRPSRPIRRIALWGDRLWRVLAGAFLACGTIGTVRTYGVLGSALLGCGLLLFACVTAYGVLFESPLSPRQVVRWAGLGTVITLAVMGVLLLFPLAGSVAVVVLGVSAPPVVARLARSLHRRQPAPVSLDQGVSACRDQAVVDREFAALVAQIEDEPR